MTYNDWRDRVAEVARSWVGTPYVDRGQVKGKYGGVDCATLLIGVYSELGVIPFFVPPYYSTQGPTHQFGEAYVKSLLGFAEPIAAGTPWDPGDVLVFRIRHAASCGHMAIYIGGDRVVHALPGGYGASRLGRAVQEDTMTRTLFNRTFEGAYRERSLVKAMLEHANS